MINHTTLFFLFMREKSDEQRIREIAARIKKLRIEKGYTSYENFAFKEALDRKQTWRMEQGQNFRITSLFKILNALDISLEDFFKGLE